MQNDHSVSSPKVVLAAILSLAMAFSTAFCDFYSERISPGKSVFSPSDIPNVGIHCSVPACKAYYVTSKTGTYIHPDTVIIIYRPPNSSSGWVCGVPYLTSHKSAQESNEH